MTKRKLKGPKRNSEFPLIELLESSLHLLKLLSLQSWLLYALGTLPFVSLFIAYWAEMTNSALAYRYLAPGALALAIAYVWMKFWQARWAIALHGTLVMHKPHSSPSQNWRILLRQTIYQPWSLLLLPLSLLLVIPFPWLLAFFQNLTVCESLDEDALHTTEKATHYASLDKKQLGLFALLWLQLLALFVFVSWLTVLGTLPYLVFTLFGIDTVFVRSPYTLLTNSVFYFTGAVMTYLTLDPLVKAFFFLRCYHADTAHTGLDILVAMRRLKRASASALLLFFAAVLCFSPSRSAAAEEAPAAPISSQKLEHAIDQASTHRKYVWERPPEPLTNTEELPAWLQSFNQFIGGIKDSLNNAFASFNKWMDGFLKKKKKEPKLTPTPPSSGNTSEVVKFLAIACLITLVLLIAFLLYRNLKRRPLTADSTNLTQNERPDLTQDEVNADALSIDSWLDYARELAARQEYRLAIRAVFLAQLAYLADQHLIVLTRFKSNREYACELARRAHAVPQALPAFHDSTQLFESIWYGDHLAAPQMLDQMEKLFYTLAESS